MTEKLQLAEARYDEISAKLSDPATAADNELYRSLMQEYKSLTPLIETFRSLKQAQARFDEARAGAGRTTDRTGSDDEFRSRKNVSAAQSEPNKLFAVLSYISILFVLPYLLCRNDEFAMFHARQGMILCVVSVIAEALGSLLGLGWVATLLRIYFILKGAGNAANGKMEPLPYIGGFFSK